MAYINENYEDCRTKRRRLLFRKLANALRQEK